MEPLAGVLVSMARSVRAVLDQGLQITVTRSKPSSESFDIHGRIIAELNLPHNIRNPTFAFVESFDVTTEFTVEIETDLSSRNGIYLDVIINANVSNQHQQVVEGLRYLYSNVLIGMEEIVMAQEDRKGQSKLIEDGKGFVKSLSITWAKLSWISRVPQGDD